MRARVGAGGKPRPLGGGVGERLRADAVGTGSDEQPRPPRCGIQFRRPNDESGQHDAGRFDGLLHFDKLSNLSYTTRFDRLSERRLASEHDAIGGDHLAVDQDDLTGLDAGDPRPGAQQHPESNESRLKSFDQAEDPAVDPGDRRPCRCGGA